MSVSGPHLEDVVVGSGLTAWATALGLLSKGRHPTLVDFGAASWSTSSRISRASRTALKGDTNPDSLFSYPELLIASSDSEYLPLTSARGGLSQIWGAGILIRDFNDFEGLGTISEDLGFAYRSISREIFTLGSEDQTSARFPLVGDSTPAPQSERYKSIVKEIQGRDCPGVLFGFPRIAFAGPVSGCQLCGLCRSGCPENLFFNARRSIEALAAQKRVTLLDGPVLTMKSRDPKLEVQLPGKTITTDRVFLCAGPIGTPALLQRSGMAGTEIAVPDSAVFYGMCFNRRSSRGDEEMFASSHMVAYSASFGPDDFQIAFYESHPELSTRLKQLLRISQIPFRIPPSIQRRLNPLIGFLDSSKSGKLILRKFGERTVVSREKNPQTREAAKYALRRVAQGSSSFGLHISPRVLICPPVGSGYHSGASMPIGGEQVNLDGSLKVQENVFVADASSLPHLWAGSHTFAAMANAFRIAHGS